MQKTDDDGDEDGAGECPFSPAPKIICIKKQSNHQLFKDFTPMQESLSNNTLMEGGNSVLHHQNKNQLSKFKLGRDEALLKPCHAANFHFYMCLGKGLNRSESIWSCQFALDLFCFASDLFQSPPNHPDSLWIWDSDPNLCTSLFLLFLLPRCAFLFLVNSHMCVPVSEHRLYTHCALRVSNWTSLQIDWVRTETLYALNLRCEHSQFIQSINHVYSCF